MSARSPIDRAITVLAALVAAAYVLVLWRTAPDMGYTRDEGYYFKAAEEYARWWGTLFSRRFLEAFGDPEIKLHFSYNTEHPALVKLSMGVTHAIVKTWLGLAGDAQGYRAAGFVFGGLSLFATFLLGRALVSPAAGLLAMGFLATHPRYFYDAHLACFDVAITAMWTLSLWAFWTGFAAPLGAPGRRRRIVRAGLVFGLALATKLNALFLPVVFVATWLATRPWRELRFGPGPSGSRELELPRVPWVLLSCALIGPIVFVAHWPWLWHETIARIGFYVGFHLNHEHYPISYFHTLFVKPPFPWHFSAVMTAVTVPGPMLALGALGLVSSVGRVLFKRSPGDVLLVAATVLPIALIALPGTPIFGGVKHWYNALPTLSILAARALLSGAEAVAEGRARPALGARVAAVLLGALALAPGALGVRASHPHGIGFYNELAGGFRGGAELGMQRGFWSGLGGALVHALPRYLPRGGSVFFNRTNYDSYRMYQREGSLPTSVYYANDAKAGAAAGLAYEQPEHAEKTGEIYSAIGPRPVAGVYQDDVALVQLHVRGLSERAPPDLVPAARTATGAPASR
jgi:4-amino-4-deoxy-L-arabinose transferase-like glycosyltransferase